MTGWGSVSHSDPRWAGPLSEMVARLCATLGPRLGPRHAGALRDVAAGLSGPLVVAVAGRISSGKSTLVNAVIGRRVAPTGAGECTRLVTRFRYGTVDRVEVVFRDGTRRALPFGAAGMIPAELGVAAERVSHLDAYLTSAVLRDLTVLDTPGLASPDTAAVRRACEVLDSGSLDSGSAAALARAEAVLYVVAQTVRADDAEQLAAFTAATGSRAAGPANALAVLNKIDTVPPESVPGAGGDPAKAAELLAAHQAGVLGHRVAGVLPAIGLLAETAETGSFNTADAQALAALVGVEPAARAALLLSADLFATLDVPVPAPARARLLELLDLHGVSCALTALDADPRLGAGELRRVLRDASGLQPLRHRLDTVFRARADGIKAAAALSGLTALAARCDAAGRALIGDGVEALLADPLAHQLRLLDAVRRVSSGAVPMPADLAEEIVLLGGSSVLAEQFGLPGHPLAELAGHALARARWWRSFAALGATPAQADLAHVVHRAYFLRWQWLKDGRCADA